MEEKVGAKEMLGGSASAAMAGLAGGASKGFASMLGGAKVSVPPHAPSWSVGHTAIADGIRMTLERSAVQAASQKAKGKAKKKEKSGDVFDIYAQFS